MYRNSENNKRIRKSGAIEPLLVCFLMIFLVTIISVNKLLNSRIPIHLQIIKYQNKLVDVFQVL